MEADGRYQVHAPRNTSLKGVTNAMASTFDGLSGDNVSEYRRYRQEVPEIASLGD